MRFFVIATVLSAACAVNAADITVNVSDSQGALKYTNNTITAKKGDIVTFRFLGGNHSVTQSESFSVPCTHLKGGFASGFHPNGGQYVVKVNDTEPIWFHCSQEGHCQAGMIGAINPPKNETVAEALNGVQATPTSASSATPTETESSPMVTSSSVQVTSSSTSVTTSSAW